MMIGSLIALYVIVGVISGLFHHASIVEEDAPRPVASTLVGVLWPAIAVLVLLVAPVIMLVEAVDILSTRRKRR